MADGGSEDDYVASEDNEKSSISSDDEFQSPAAAQRQNARYQSKSNNRSVQGYLSKDYRDLLNLDIEDVQGRVRTTELEASQIGASRWTSREKDALFLSLASCSPSNLQALGRAVRTKSEQEIHVYLLLLRAGVIAQETTQVGRQKHNLFTHDEIPAAAEISADGEHVLDLAADALAAHVEKHISQQQREKYGDDWLVDADVAERMDMLQEQSQSEIDAVAKSVAEAGEANTSEAHSHAPFNASFDTLLRPSAFLQLSRNIYMNNGEDDDLNWHHICPVSVESTEPALFRSTLEDLRNIVVNMTRRVVQATIFQATSRLRAEDASRKDWTPLKAIREVDVRTATDLLNLPRDSKSYWANTTRRCKVGVFSDSKKYDDGRASTKSGHLLTYEEVATELGLRNIKDAAVSPKLEAQDLDEDDIDARMDDSDLFTEEESVTSSTEAHLDSRDRTSTKAPNKRKRALGPRSSLRAETRHLEAIDKVTSVREERRLWKLLRRDPPAHIAMNHKIPAGRMPVDSFTSNNGDWRAKLDYESEWEQPGGIPAAERFSDMDALGKAGKMKRELLLKKLEQRLEMDIDHDDIETDEKDVETDSASGEETEPEVKTPTSPVGDDDRG